MISRSLAPFPPADRCRSLRKSEDSDLNESNPYSAPQKLGERTETESQSRSSLRVVRLLFYLHLAVVCFWAAFTLSDTRKIALPQIIQQLFYVRAIQGPLAFTWMLFPALMASAVSRLSDRLRWHRVAIVACDVLLSGFQLWVMLPLVQ